MKRLLLAFPLGLAFISSVGATPVPLAHATHAQKAIRSAHASVSKRAPSAPADEYFGHQKLSILGVRNVIHDLKIRYDGSVGRADMVMNIGGSTEEAMTAWGEKYPGDMWLAHNMFQLEQIYLRLPTDAGKKRSAALASTIIKNYPGTYYSKYLITIRRVALQHAQTLASATPAPVSASALSSSANSSLVNSIAIQTSNTLQVAPRQIPAPAPAAASPAPTSAPVLIRPAYEINAQPITTQTSSSPTTKPASGVAPLDPSQIF